MSVAAAKKVRCRKTNDCPPGLTCTASHYCREPRPRGRPHGPEGTTEFARVCASKNIPLVFERGPRKGDPKDREALRRCKYQVRRTKKPPNYDYNEMNYMQLHVTYLALLASNETFKEFMSHKKKVARPSADSLRQLLKEFQQKM